MGNFEEQVLAMFAKIKFKAFRGNRKPSNHHKTNLLKKLVNTFRHYSFFAFCCLHTFSKIVKLFSTNSRPIRKSSSQTAKCDPLCVNTIQFK